MNWWDRYKRTLNYSSKPKSLLLPLNGYYKLQLPYRAANTLDSDRYHALSESDPFAKHGSEFQYFTIRIYMVSVPTKTYIKGMSIYFHKNN